MNRTPRSAHAGKRAPQATHRTLTSEREIGAYLHRTRLSILDALRAGPATVSQIAATAGVHPANLTRHVRILEGAGLVVLVEKRDTGRNLEKYYQATAHTFDVAPDANALTAPHKIALAMARSELSAALARLPDASPGAVQVFSVGARLTRTRMRDFLGALARLAAEFEAADADAGAPFRMTLAMFPGEDGDARQPTRVVLARRRKPRRKPGRNVDRWKSEAARCSRRALRERGGIARREANVDAAEIVSSAWDAWRSGDFTQARARSGLAIQRGEAVDEARHVFALAAHVTGHHADAITAHGAIGARYRRLAELDEPILWSYLRLGDLAAAHAFAGRRGLLRNRATRERFRLAAGKPLRVEVSGLVELPFTDDAFSPLMPGVEVRVMGRPLVARLDTGGSYLHVTKSQARALGIEYGGCERGFAALFKSTICYGAADLDLGGARIRNAPVSVHADDTFPVGAVASAFGVEMGPVIGTNVFRQFLTTIDAPQKRLLLSRRGDATARAAHVDRLSGHAHEAPFALLGEHYMIARGRVGDARDLNVFVDSGLAFFRSDQGQAGLLVSTSTLEAWGIPAPPEGCFAEIPGPVGLGPLRQQGMTAVAVPDRTWRGFGDWSGIRVEALLSHAFLKHYAWTIDFDRRVYVFHVG